MQNLLSCEDFLTESKIYTAFEDVSFTNEQITESLYYLECEDPKIFEAWYNTVLDFAALIPVVGSVAEGINLVSYAKQGRYLLAALCAIGLIPLFGQYIGAGGSFIVKILEKGGKIGKSVLRPLLNAIAKFFPKILGFLKSGKFAEKFPGISTFVPKMGKALEDFVKTGGTRLAKYAANPGKLKAIRKEALYLKQGTKVISSIFGSKKIGTHLVNQIPVPKDAYLAYQGTPLKNIRPYTDTEISSSVLATDWTKYLGELI